VQISVTVPAAVTCTGRSHGLRNPVPASRYLNNVTVSHSTEDCLRRLPGCLVS